jgi:hypothetical protein
MWYTLTSVLVSRCGAYKYSWGLPLDKPLQMCYIIGMKMKKDNDSRRQCRTTVGVREIRRDGPHRLTNSPAGVRSGDRNCSHDWCTDKIFDYYKDYPLCEPHYNEHIYLQKVMMSMTRKTAV